MVKFKTSIIVLAMTGFLEANALPIAQQSDQIINHYPGSKEYHIANSAQSSGEPAYNGIERPSRRLKRAPPTPGGSSSGDTNIARPETSVDVTGQSGPSNSGQRKESGVFTVDLYNDKDCYYLIKTKIGKKGDENARKTFYLAVDTGSADILVYDDKCKAKTLSGPIRANRGIYGHQTYTPSAPAAQGSELIKPSRVKPSVGFMRKEVEQGPISFKAGFGQSLAGSGTLAVDEVSVGDSESVLQWFGCWLSLEKGSGADLIRHWNMDGIFRLGSTSKQTQFYRLPKDKLPGYMSWISSSIYWRKNKMKSSNAVFTLDLIHTSHEKHYGVKSSITFGKCTCEPTRHEKSFELDGSGLYEFVAKSSNSQQERKFLIDSGDAGLLLFEEQIESYVAELIKKRVKITGPHPYTLSHRDQPGKGPGTGHYEVACNAKLPNLKLELVVDGKQHNFDVPGESLIFRDFEVPKKKGFCVASFGVIMSRKDTAPSAPQHDRGVLGISFLQSVKGCFTLDASDIPKALIVPESDSDSSRPESSQGNAENIPSISGASGPLRRRMMEPEAPAEPSSAANDPSGEAATKSIFTYCSKEIDVLAPIK